MTEESQIPSSEQKVTHKRKVLNTILPIFLLILAGVSIAFQAGKMSLI